MLTDSEIYSLKHPAASAEIVGLRYVSDRIPGICREGNQSRFRYRAPSGRVTRDASTLARIRSLAIPPAWKEVWICPDPDGHLQATGRDDRGRKQFRYHPRWTEVRDETKFARIISFARALPKMRRRIQRDLSLPGLPRNKVLAAVVRLLETSLIRIGNDEYARSNESFGLTTLRDRHARVNGSTIQFQFRGKSGKSHQVGISDRRLARIVKSCQDLPGQELFQFMDEAHERRDVRSEDVNAYVREISGGDFTAKDFRTWAGTILAAIALRDRCAPRKAPTRKNLATAIECVAHKLGNTPAVCRKCYIHPHVLDSYLDGTLMDAVRGQVTKADRSRGLQPGEAAVLKLLQRRLTLEQKLSKSLRRETRAKRSVQKPRS